MLGNLTWQRFWMKENYDKNEEFKITRIFLSKTGMCYTLFFCVRFYIPRTWFLLTRLFGDVANYHNSNFVFYVHLTQILGFLFRQNLFSTSFTSSLTLSFMYTFSSPCTQLLPLNFKLKSCTLLSVFQSWNFQLNYLQILSQYQLFYQQLEIKLIHLLQFFSFGRFSGNDGGR